MGAVDKMNVFVYKDRYFRSTLHHAQSPKEGGVMHYIYVVYVILSLGIGSRGVYNIVHHQTSDGIFQLVIALAVAGFGISRVRKDRT